MARTRSFVPTDAVRAARDRFWEHGYEGTSLADLERVTGLNRSSLYQAFGSKRRLFGLALDNYLTEVVEPRLTPLEAPDAGIPAVVGYLRTLAATLADSPADLARRGCLIVNTTTERAARDPAAHAVATGYRDRIHHAIATALSHARLDTARPDTAGPDTAARRAELLTGTVIAALVTARLSPPAAARLANAAAAEAATWAPDARPGP